MIFHRYNINARWTVWKLSYIEFISLKYENYISSTKTTINKSIFQGHLNWITLKMLLFLNLFFNISVFTDIYLIFNTQRALTLCCFTYLLIEYRTWSWATSWLDYNRQLFTNVGDSSVTNHFEVACFGLSVIEQPLCKCAFTFH